MVQIINFNKYKAHNSNGEKITTASSRFESLDADPLDVEVDVFRTNLDILVKNNPDKVLFSLNEAAHFLNVGSEFIRRRIKSGKIQATYLGDKPFISIVELAHIITKGV